MLLAYVPHTSHYQKALMVPLILLMLGPQQYPNHLNLKNMVLGTCQEFKCAMSYQNYVVDGGRLSKLLIGMVLRLAQKKTIES